MAAVVPKDVVAKIQYFVTHAPRWAEVAGEIGSSAAEIAALADLTEAARAARAAQQQALDAARAATADLHLAVDAMARAGADVIRKVRAKAATDGDPIYSLAWVPVPGRPSPIAAPGTPSRFEVAIRQDGSLALTWRCENPRGARGTIYRVARQTDGQGGAGAFEEIAAVGVKRFVDRAVPAGARSVTYRVTAVRSTASGTPAEFTVRFGGAGGGAATEFRAAGRAA
jgi:hypothetical protein